VTRTSSPRSARSRYSRESLLELADTDIRHVATYATVLDFHDGLITRFLVIQDLTAVVDAYRGD
jgi:hypothetical protein